MTRDRNTLPAFGGRPRWTSQKISMSALLLRYEVWCGRGFASNGLIRLRGIYLDYVFWGLPALGCLQRAVP